MNEVDDKLREWWEAKVQRLEAELQKRDQEIRRLKSRFGPAPRLEGS